MQKWLSMRKIHTIMRVGRLKKIPDAMKTYMFFSIDFSLIFGEKPLQNCIITVKKRSSARKLTKNLLQGDFFGQKIDFLLIFGLPLGPLGPPGVSQEPSRSLSFFDRFLAASEHRAESAPGTSQGGPSCASGTLRALYSVDFDSIFRVDFHTHSFKDALIFWATFLVFYISFLNLSFCMWSWLGRPRNNQTDKPNKQAIEFWLILGIPLRPLGTPDALRSSFSVDFGSIFKDDIHAHS